MRAHRTPLSERYRSVLFRASAAPTVSATEEPSSLTATVLTSSVMRDALRLSTSQSAWEQPEMSFSRRAKKLLSLLRGGREGGAAFFVDAARAST